MAETEQGGVSPATAGGASAPDFNAIRDALADTFRAVPLWQFRQGLIAAGLIPADVEIQAAERKPVDGGPGIEAEWDEDADAMRIDGIGWDLSFGCKVSFAYDHDKGEYYVCVSTSDADQRAGITSRRTTKEELASLGQQLVNVFGEPDPRDAEIERMRKEYDEVLVSGVLRETLDAEIERLRRDLITEQDEHLAAKALLTEAREEWKRGNAEIEKLRKRLVYDLGLSGGQWSGLSLMELLQRLKAMYTTALEEARSRNGDMRAEIEELEKQRDDLTEAARAKEQQLFVRFAELLNPIREVFGKSPVGASHYREVHAGIRNLICALRAARERLGAVEADVLNALASRDRLAAQVTDLAAERDHLRAELDLMTQAFVTVQGVLNATDEKFARKTIADHVRGETVKPEPRRWVAGDPEPEVGTAITWGAGKSVWELHDDGDWRSKSCLCKQCASMPGLSWDELLAYAPLVEVVTTDG